MGIIVRTLCLNGAVVALTLVVLSACDKPPGPSVADVSTPAATPTATPTAAVEVMGPLLPYSKDSAKAVTLAGDPVLFKFFCKALGSETCDAATMKRLKDHGYVDGQPAFELAIAAVSTKAQGADTTVKVADQAFVSAAYQMLLGRPVDPSGLDYWTKIVASGERAKFVKDLLFSPEFAKQPV